uniref:Sulfatase-modifying factor enzyme domain-containing protein n=1 Tax=Chlamydomonas euryale TaxID=1486919 RepID=A0A7R9VIT3_9CHLO|mmetsp:Transcript_36904/g.108802  ORF Transcript_36904/g.108802 Transcript_36904/m.108802 type:complete len:886 (+) Transcript_36904:487-3144(+)
MATRNPSLNIRPGLARGDVGGNAAAAAAALGSEEAELHGARGDWWWTGKPPAQCPGYDADAGVIRSLPLPPTSGFTRQQVLDCFDNCWTLTEVLFASLQGRDAFVRQPYHQLRHPMIFYYGHPACLYTNKFRVAGLLDDPIDQYFEQLFETGVDEMSWDDLSQKQEDWPSVRYCHEYRQRCYSLVRGLLETHPGLADGATVTWDDPCWAVFMCFEHERIHIETSSVLMRELPLLSVRKPEFWPDYHPSATQPSPAIPTEGADFPRNDLLPVDGERVVLGKPSEYPSFGWDNEYGTKAVTVQPFSASKFKVTNGEFLAFVRAGGYANIKYWSTEGWGWKTFRNVKWPTFWIPDGPQGLHKYKLRALFDAVDMRWDWPVDANYHEARAFCAWKTETEGSDVAYRLATEAEHNLLRSAGDRVDVGRDAADGWATAKALDATANVDVAMVAGGADMQRLGFNMQLAHSSQSPVTELPPSTKGFHDVFGNAWEWVEDHYAAYPGFKVHPFYEDFSSPCFGGKHQLIVGGSFISTGQLCSKFARYQFRPHFFQHASFRVVLQAVDRSLYDMERYGVDAPLRPFFETSCMDCAPPYVGDGPCCSVHRRSRFTPTVVEGREQGQAKQDATQLAYETDTAVSQYLAQHFGPPAAVYRQELLAESGLLQLSREAPRRTAEELIAWASRTAAGDGGLGTARALDLGCAVGRAAFTLAGAFGDVVGVDISARFVEVANKLRDARAMDFDLAVEGEVTERCTAALEDGIDTSRVRFVQGDACRLPGHLGQFDAVLAAGLLDCVPEPAALLKQVAAALRPGGVALLTCAFAWDDAKTNRANWVGGTYVDGVPERGPDALSVLAADDFVLLSEGTVPVLLASSARTLTLQLAHQVVLQRR